MKLFSKLLILSLSLTLSPILRGQALEKEKKIRFDSPITSYSTDIEQNIYLGFSNGTLITLDKEGNQIQDFAIPNQAEITLVEAQNNRRIFLFSAPIQQITLLDRFSTQPKHYSLQDYGIEYATMSCPSPDGTIWIAENNPVRLKKIDLLRKTVLHEVQSNLGDSVKYMRAYKNLLLVIAKDQLYIFDQFGNNLSEVDLNKISGLQISKGKILATYEKGLVLIDPYERKTSLFFEFPSEKMAVFHLKDRYTIIRKKSVTFLMDQ